MTQQTITAVAGAAVPGAGTACDRATRVTKTLLAYGVITGPLYILVSVAQALTRDGFDLAHHEWSLLANGAHGWIQITNLVVTGLMTVALAVGLRRALRPGQGGTWAPRLVGAYGVGLVGAGVPRRPGFGLPAGNPTRGGSSQLARHAWHPPRSAV